MGRVHCCVGSHLRAAEVLLTPKLPFSSSAIRFKAGLGFWPCSHVKVISLGVPFNSSFTFTLLPPPPFAFNVFILGYFGGRHQNTLRNLLLPTDLTGSE